MAYFVSTSQHPVALICFKNSAIGEWQWRTRDVMHLAEQSHALSQSALGTNHRAFYKKSAASPWLKVAEYRTAEIKTVDAEPQPPTVSHQVLPPTEVWHEPLTPVAATPSASASPVSGSDLTSSSLIGGAPAPQLVTAPAGNPAAFSFWSWGGLGAGSLLIAAAAGGGSKTSASTPSTTNQVSDNHLLSQETSTTLQGMVMAGPLTAGHGLTVNVYNAEGVSLATGVVVDELGHFSLLLKNSAGKTVLVQVVNKDNGADYVDEASGQAKDMGVNLRAVIMLGQQTTQALSVTPLTELAAQMLLKNASSQAVYRLSHLTETDVNQYSLAVSKALGIDDQLPVTSLQPAVLSEPSGIGLNMNNSNSSAVKYAKALAVVSSMEKAGNTGLQEALAKLQQGMIDGINGKLSAAVLGQLLTDVHKQGRIISRSEIKSQLDPQNNIIPVEIDVYRLSADTIPDQTASNSDGIVVGSLQKNNPVSLVHLK